MNAAKLVWFKNCQKRIKLSIQDQIKVYFNLQYDNEGLLRVYSRFKNMPSSFGVEAPIFIDLNHELANLIVYKIHKNVLHHGVKQTLAELRWYFWIIRGRLFGSNLMSSCVWRDA